MANRARLCIEADRFLRALQPLCALIDDHLLINASGRISLANMLRQHCELSPRAKFYSLGPQDFQMLTLGLATVVYNFRVVERHTDLRGAKSTVLEGSAGIVLGVLRAAENYTCSISRAVVLAEDLKQALKNRKELCARLTRQREVRSKTQYKRRSEAHRLIQRAHLPLTLEDLLEEGELTEQAMQQLAAFLTYYSDIEGDVRNLFKSLRECMVPRELLETSMGNVYECVRSMRRELSTGILPIRVFEGSTWYVTNLNSLCAQYTGWRYVGGERMVQFTSVSSARYEELMTKMNRGEVDIGNYISDCHSGMSRVVTMRHLLEQRRLDADARALHSKIQYIVASTTIIERRIQATVEAAAQIMPRINRDQLALTTVHE